MRARRAAAVTFTAGAVLAGTVVAITPAQAAAPTVTASGAFMFNPGTGKTLFSKAADTKRPMASTTKIMSALVVLQTPGLDLNRKITLTQTHINYTTSVYGSSAHIFAGDKLTTAGMLNAMLAPSGCDAAAALADAYGKGTSFTARKANFISQMNAKAKALGLVNTKFDSFDGNSPTKNNWTTPRDLAKLTQIALKNATFASIVKTPYAKATATASNGKPRWYTWKNSNLLIRPTTDPQKGYAYPGAVGVKTGTNTPAGPCLVFAVTRNGKTVIGVLLNDANRYTSAIKLGNYAFGTQYRMPQKPIPDTED
ncbi:serine hydrolase [Streptomyces bambusae]|uniref:D-alanyl-D-alanine carboxypeptidase family protein n=1 Tax=Streptomyces bambusae TaxID=1550616 RepID=UPI001CFDE659|nr:serine hydrolase [Streptomyces bambusae]MCB5163409.1 serine hydrolase [Streptomyces bambusae]